MAATETKLKQRNGDGRRKGVKSAPDVPNYTGPFETLIYDKSRPGQVGFMLPDNGLDNEHSLDVSHVREEVHLPEVSELDVVRHFTRLSRQNFSIDSNFYPLGSCTMKYNPRMNEVTSAMPAFQQSHPMLPDHLAQGNLRLFHELHKLLLEITGFDALSLQPAAGAQGELAGMLMIHAYLKSKGEAQRKKVLIPDSAHGTNPATCILAGLEPVELPSGPDGLVDMDELKKHLGDDTAGMMLTNPNTLGLFETNILEITRLIHEAGGQVYCDGANMNAMVGVVRPGDMDIDVMHLNLHKTFSTPHGGGGPGAGTVAVKEHLAPFLPSPVLVERDGEYGWDYDRPQALGRLHTFNGNFLILVRALTYILELGSQGAKEVGEGAVLKANYIRQRLKGIYHLAHDTICMHECVFSDKKQQKHGVKTMDIAKRLVDFGFHPPTVYFPLIVPGALMIEPTETESKATLDGFIEAMITIAKECETEPETVTSAPHELEYRRLDEVHAAKNLDLNVFQGK